MDRVDIHIDVPAVPYKRFRQCVVRNPCESIRSRVVAARSVRLHRFYDEHIYTNAQMGTAATQVLRTHGRLRKDHAVTEPSSPG